MIQCPNCGAQNEDGTLFCDQCLVDLAGVPSGGGGDAGGMPADASASEVAPLDSAADMGSSDMGSSEMGSSELSVEMSESSMSMEASIEGSVEGSELGLDQATMPMDAPPGSGVGLDAPPMEMGTGSQGAPGSIVSVGFDAPPEVGMEGGTLPVTSGFALAPDGAPAGDPGLELPLGSDLDVGMTAPGGPSPSQVGPPMSPSQLGMPPLTPSKLGAPGGSPSQVGMQGLMGGDIGAPGVSPSQLGAPPVSPSKLGAMGGTPSQLGAPPLSPSKLGGPPVSPSKLGAPPMLMPTTPSHTVARLSPIAMAKLVVVRGLKTAMEYPVYEGPNFIGRFDEKPVDIDITEQEDTEKPRSSRQHACVTWETTGLFIEDLSSSNGTFVNRVRVSPGEKKPLRNGDYIQTGNVLFQIKV